MLRPISSDNRKLQNALTIGELIDELRNYDRDTKVVFACDYGDYSHTQQALPVETCDEIDLYHEAIEESAYSRSGLAISERRDSDYEEEDGIPEQPEGVSVIILR